MTIWIRLVDDQNAAFNVAAMANAGFEVDRGRSLTREEIDKLNLTPPPEIRPDCYINGAYYWGEK